MDPEHPHLFYSRVWHRRSHRPRAAVELQGVSSSTLENTHTSSSNLSNGCSMHGIAIGARAVLIPTIQGFLSTKGLIHVAGSVSFVVILGLHGNVFTSFIYFLISHTIDASSPCFLREFLLYLWMRGDVYNNRVLCHEHQTCKNHSTAAYHCSWPYCFCTSLV